MSIRDTPIMWNWKQGEHSNIPRCCRVYFLIRAWLCVPELIGVHPRVAWAWRSTFGRHGDYIRCFICFVRGRRSKIHHCDMSCVGLEGAAPNSAIRRRLVKASKES